MCQVLNRFMNCFKGRCIYTCVYGAYTTLLHLFSIVIQLYLHYVQYMHYGEDISYIQTKICAFLFKKSKLLQCVQFNFLFYITLNLNNYLSLGVKDSCNMFPSFLSIIQLFLTITWPANYLFNIHIQYITCKFFQNIDWTGCKAGVITCQGQL